jgi:exopolysaccharide biosynthesis polyprenyl glycosylphosphotransferase
MLDRSSTRYVAFLYLADLALTLAALALALLVRPHLPFGKELIGPGGEIKPGIYLTALLVWAVALPMAGAYEARRIVHAGDEAKVVAVGVVQSTLILAGFLYMTFRDLSRLLFVTFFVFDLALILAARLALRVALQRSQPVPGHSVLIIGTNKVAASVGEQVVELRWMGLELAGYISEDGIAGGATTEEQNGNGQKLNGPLLGQLENVPDLVRSLGIAELIIALPLRAHDALPKIMMTLGDLPVNIKVVPDFFDLVYLRSTIEEMGGVPMIGIKEPAISPFGRMVKRLLDVAVASLALIISAPLVAVTAIIIRLDSPGPVVFRQRRVGEGGRPFWMYKLRTMVADAEAHESELMVRESDGRVFFHKQPEDPRLTRLGRLLRRFSLDEIPQFVNVLKGEMSLVGPRPELPMIVESYRPWQHKRFAVPPGMTGWWQVQGRSQQPLHLRTEDDLYYIQNYSLLLDLRILWKTVGAVISGRGAY